MNKITVSSNMNESRFTPFDEYTSKLMNCWKENWTDSQIRKTYYGLNAQTDYMVDEFERMRCLPMVLH